MPPLLGTSFVYVVHNCLCLIGQQLLMQCTVFGILPLFVCTAFCVYTELSLCSDQRCLFRQCTALCVYAVLCLITDHLLSSSHKLWKVVGLVLNTIFALIHFTATVILQTVIFCLLLQLSYFAYFKLVQTEWLLMGVYWKNIKWKVMKQNRCFCWIYENSVFLGQQTEEIKQRQE